MIFSSPCVIIFYRSIAEETTEMAETEEEKTQETVAEEASAREEETAGQPREQVSAREAEAPEEPEESPVIWSQKRVPNIKKGYDPTVPFYMMGIFAALIVLSVIFAKITS